MCKANSRIIVFHKIFQEHFWCGNTLSPSSMEQPHRPLLKPILKVQTLTTPKVSTNSDPHPIDDDKSKEIPTMMTMERNHVEQR
jgi:hypothetical protein